MKIWRLDPPDCDCDKLRKKPEHDKPEWRLVSDIRPAGAISAHEPRLLSGPLSNGRTPVFGTGGDGSNPSGPMAP